MGNHRSIEKDDVTTETIHQLIFSGCQLTSSQARELYSHYNNELLHIEKYLISHPGSKSKDIVNVIERNDITGICKIGYYKGTIYGVHFEDDFIGVLFEYKSGVFQENCSLLWAWYRLPRKTRLGRTVIMTTVSNRKLDDVYFVTNVKFTEEG